MDRPSVGFIGVGAMGGPMALNVLRAGFPLMVCDRNSAATAPLIQAGAVLAATPADCAGADVIILMVATADQAETVIFGAGGILHAAKAGASAPVIALMGTVSPEWLVDASARLSAEGISLIDAPISGGVSKAQDGTLAIMMGGAPEICERLRPLMAAMGTAIFRCGAVGTGQVTKILNNLVGISIITVAAEAYRIAIERGLDFAAIMPVFEAGTGRNYMTQDAQIAPKAFAAWATSSEGFDNLVSILRKDLDLALELGAGLPMPMTAAVRGGIDHLGAESYEAWREIANKKGDPAQF